MEQALVINPDQFLYTPEGKYEWTKDRLKVAWDKSRDIFLEAVISGKYHRLILLIGAPGAGKSTWLEKNQTQGTIYFDATFATPGNRSFWIWEARKRRIAVGALRFDTPLEVCLERNRLRSPDRKVPEDIVRKIWTKILMSPPDSEKEKLNFLYRVG